jgi:NADH-quinone oxidoreductase subunit N
MNPFYTATDHFVLLPAILLGLFGCLALFFERRGGLAVLLLGEFFTGLMLTRHAIQLESTGLPMIGFQGALTVDGLSLVFNFLFVAGALLCALISYRYLEIEGEHENEYYGLMLFAQAGMYLMATGTELVTLFTGLETMSVSFYVLAGFLRADRRSNEAAMKYLLLGAFSTGFLGYGFSLLYGLAASTRLTAIGQALTDADASSPLLVIAIVTIAVGLLFKAGAAPFHMWAPDAYEGAPTPVTAFLSTASKAAAIVLTMRLLLGPLAGLRPVWEPMMIAAGLASLTIGNFAALTQTNIKRMLAYSSISHIGYILLAIAAGSAAGYRAAILYTVVYAFMNLGAFLVLIALRRASLPGENLDDFSGLIHRAPGYAIWMLVFLLSLAGIPPTAGFLAKYYVFLALVENQRYLLAIAGAAYVAVSLYYYFRIVRAMFAGPLRGQEPLASSWGIRVALAATAALTAGLGLYPEPLLRWMRVAG